MSNTTYLSFRKAMLSAVRKAARRDNGLRRNPNPAVDGANVKNLSPHKTENNLQL